MHQDPQRLSFSTFNNNQVDAPRPERPLRVTNMQQRVRSGCGQKTPACMCGASRTVSPAFTRSGATNCGLSVSSRKSRTRRASSCSRQSVVPHSAGFARMLERAGEAAKLDFKAHPHMLRHACGYALVNKGHDTPARRPHPRARRSHRRTIRDRRRGSCSR